MIAFGGRLAQQWRLVHPVLAEVVFDFVAIWREITGESGLYATSIFRRRADTLRIYEAAGLEPPAVSVHESSHDPSEPLSGCRGVDVGVRRIFSGQPGTVDPADAAMAVDALNTRWRYQASDAHQVALFHKVDGWHVHLQCRPLAETCRR